MKEKDQIIDDTLLTKSILKRREWGVKYNIKQDVIYDLFSEFSSMLMIKKMQKANVKTVYKNKYKPNLKKPADKMIDESKLSDLFVMNADSKMSTEHYSRMQRKPITNCKT